MAETTNVSKVPDWTHGTWKHNKHGSFVQNFVQHACRYQSFYTFQNGLETGLVHCVVGQNGYDIFTGNQGFAFASPVEPVMLAGNNAVDDRRYQQDTGRYQRYLNDQAILRAKLIELAGPENLIGLGFGQYNSLVLVTTEQIMQHLGQIASANEPEMIDQSLRDMSDKTDIHTADDMTAYAINTNSTERYRSSMELGCR